MSKINILFKVLFSSSNLLTFSSLDWVETDGDEFPLDVCVSGKRWRFNRTDFVSFVDVVSLDVIMSKRLPIDDGGEISAAKIKIFLMITIVDKVIKIIYLIENLIWISLLRFFLQSNHYHSFFLSKMNWYYSMKQQHDLMMVLFEQ